MLDVTETIQQYHSYLATDRCKACLGSTIPICSKYRGVASQYHYKKIEIGAHSAILLVAALAGTNNVCASKCRDTPDHMHWAAASKVDEADTEEALTHLLRR